MATVRFAEGAERASALEVLLREAPSLPKTLPVGLSLDKRCSDYSVDGCTSLHGLFVNLKFFTVVSLEHLPLDAALTNCRVYLHLASEPLEEPADGPLSDLYDSTPLELADPRAALQRLEEKHRRLWEQLKFLKLDDPEVPASVLQIAHSVQSDEESTTSATLLTAWEEEIKISKYAANLPVVENPPRIPPSGWKCADCGGTKNLWLNLSDGFIGCGRKLFGAGGGCTDGREGAAIRHFEETGRQYPLIVKLGTITTTSGDVFSYASDEDATVRDPLLPEHLARFGVDIQKLAKTERSTTELAVDVNSQFEWSALVEGGQTDGLSGSSLGVGLLNLGNSCYINASLQALASIPQFVQSCKKLYLVLLAAVASASSRSPLQLRTKIQQDAFLQLSQLVSALVSRRAEMQRLERTEALLSAFPSHSLSASDVVRELPYLASDWLAPCAFRRLVGSLHAEFSGSQQQDVEEFLSRLLEALSTALPATRLRLRLFSERVATGEEGKEMIALRSLGLTRDSLPDARRALDELSVDSLFTFSLEQRLECGQTSRVRYQYTPQPVLALPIPLDAEPDAADVNQRVKKLRGSQDASKEEAGAAVQIALQKPEDCEGDSCATSAPSSPFTPPVVSLASCLKAFSAPSALTDYLSPATGKRGTAVKQLRLANMPAHLLVLLKRFYVDSSWVAQKIDNAVQIPDSISLEELRGVGLRPDELELPGEEDDAKDAERPTDSSETRKEEVAQLKERQEQERVQQVINAITAMGFSENAALYESTPLRNDGKG